MYRLSKKAGIIFALILAVIGCSMMLFNTLEADADDTLIIPEVEEEVLIDRVPDAKVTMVTTPLPIPKPTPKPKRKPKPKKVKKQKKVNKINMSESDMKLLAMLTMAEAEGESEYGQRLVIDTVLNRMDSKHFPDTVRGVIYQPSQFSSMWNGRIDRCYVKDDIYKLVVEEVKSRTNRKVMFFTAGAYGKYGKPMFKVGNHYFASY